MSMVVGRSFCEEPVPLTSTVSCTRPVCERSHESSTHIDFSRHRHEHARLSSREEWDGSKCLRGTPSCSRGARNRSGQGRFWSQMSSRERISKDSERHRAAAAHEAGGSRTRARIPLREELNGCRGRSFLHFGARSGNGSGETNMKEARRKQKHSGRARRAARGKTRRRRASCLFTRRRYYVSM